VDGLHVSDLQYITTTLLPNGNLSYLAGLGTTYSNASTSAPSDSFPGIMALHTGAACTLDRECLELALSLSWTNAMRGQTNCSPGIVALYTSVASDAGTRPLCMQSQLQGESFPE